MAEKFYESDITRFVRKLIEEKPQILDEQRNSRAAWWDKKLDPDSLRRARESRVEQPAYVYYQLKP